MTRKSIVIIGPGIIGRDLLIKIKKRGDFNCLGVIGRTEGGDSERFVKNEGFRYFTGSLEKILNDIVPDIFIDATDATSHKYHVDLLRNFNSYIVDLTPSGLGKSYFPLIKNFNFVDNKDISLISCGGQTVLPILFMIKECFIKINYIEVVSSMSSSSVGPATRKNLDEYVETTENSILNYIPTKKVKVMLNVNPATPPVVMKSTISIDGELLKDIENIKKVARECEEFVRQYCPGYKLKIPPTIMIDNRILLMIQVTGNGDYLPKYSGNLDIINSSCIFLCNELAKLKNHD